MVDNSVSAAGDPYHAAKARELAELEERYAHELMGAEERQELRDRSIKARRDLNAAR